MFYELEIRGHVRIHPKLFSEDIKLAVLNSLNELFENYISKDFGIIIGVTDVIKLGDGIIIPGDGAAYYDTIFKVLVFKPELQEVVKGKISEIAEFGSFINMGVMDGMIHIGQTMDDYVSYTKSGVLSGKESKKVLKVGDVCMARVIAISYKDITSPKIGLTMRQPALGAEHWFKKK